MRSYNYRNNRSSPSSASRRPFLVANCDGYLCVLLIFTVCVGIARSQAYSLAPETAAQAVRLRPDTQALAPPRPDYLRNLDLWHCGTDNLTKTLSLMFIGACPHEPLNWCCFQHDRCYDFYQHFIGLLRVCDEQFGYCVRIGYQTNQFCANWLYTTHVDTVRLFGEGYKQMLASKP